MNAASTPIAPSTKKGHGHPNWETNHPESGEKMPTAKYDAEAKSEVARPRSDFGNHITATRAFAGKLGPSMRPRANRSPNKRAMATVTSVVNLPTNPMRKVDTDQSTRVRP